MAHKLVKLVADELKYLDPEVIQEILDTFFLKVIIDKLRKDGEVKTSYGRFYVKEVEKNIYNFQKGRTETQTLNYIRFKPSKMFRQFYRGNEDEEV